MKKNSYVFIFQVAGSFFIDFYEKVWLLLFSLGLQTSRILTKSLPTKYSNGDLNIIDFFVWFFNFTFTNHTLLIWLIEKRNFEQSENIFVRFVRILKSGEAEVMWRKQKSFCWKEIHKYFHIPSNMNIKLINIWSCFRIGLRITMSWMMWCSNR